MAHFTADSLDVRVTGHFKWTLLTDVIFFPSESLEKVLVVPAEFETDFASIPRALWGMFPPYHPHYGKAAILHDYGYKLKGVFPDQKFSRYAVDLLFAEAMRALGNSEASTTVIYRAVRLFGRKHWK